MDNPADADKVARAKRDYVNGYGSVPSIAQKYGLNERNLKARAGEKDGQS